MRAGVLLAARQFENGFQKAAWRSPLVGIALGAFGLGGVSSTHNICHADLCFGAATKVLPEAMSIRLGKD